jgi:hypothetical protein
MSKTVMGIVRGKTIELAEDLGVAEGRKVQVSVTVVDSTTPTGEGLRRTAGALADDADWDQIMDEIHERRCSQAGDSQSIAPQSLP